jgi:hypothetical protein
VCAFAPLIDKVTDVALESDTQETLTCKDVVSAVHVRVSSSVFLLKLMEKMHASRSSISFHYVRKRTLFTMGIKRRPSILPCAVPHFNREDAMKTLQNITLSLAVLALLAACGSKTSDRTLSGAGIGAGVGAVSGALLGSPATGAIVGGALGAAAGGLTKEEDIDLGEPVWR